MITLVVSSFEEKGLDKAVVEVVPPIIFPITAFSSGLNRQRIVKVFSRLCAPADLVSIRKNPTANPSQREIRSADAGCASVSQKLPPLLNRNKG